MTLTMDGNTEGTLQESVKPYSFSIVPYKMENQLEFIDISEDGYLLLGSSNLVYNYWNGSFWYFKDADLAPEKKYSLTGQGCEYSIACGQFLDNKEKIIIGDDSGAITVYHFTSFEDETIHVMPQMTSLHHDSSVTSLSITSSKEQSISAGTDLAINIWDNESLISEHKYVLAHSRSITSIKATKEENSSVFASSSLDGSALLWDSRLREAACCIKQQQGCGFTALCWKDTNEIAIGYQCGMISISDIRSKNNIVEDVMMDCSIHKLAFDKNLLGICGDSKTVKIWDYDSRNIIYSDERHTGLVRDILWHPKTHKLYSCGFHKQVFSHQVSTTES